MVRRYTPEAIVIGLSLGGMKVLSAILPALPIDFFLPILIVQHRHVDSDEFLSEYLNKMSTINVVTAEDKMPLQSKTVYIAPPNYHMLVESNKTICLSDDPPINYSRPSIDELFESAAYVYQDKLIGIILTGANTDGSEGLKIIKRYGGLTIAQDPTTAEIDDMPKAAIAKTQVDYVLNLKEIIAFITNISATRVISTKTP